MDRLWRVDGNPASVCSHRRTCAIGWILEIGRDQVQTRHSEPFWSESAAAVLCQQRHLLFGLEIKRSQVRYTPIDPELATDIFVRKGLVEQGILETPHFLEHNAQLMKLAASEQVRLRLGSSERIEDQLYDFYRQQLDAVGSYPELRRYAKSKHQGRMDFLCAALSDLVPEQGCTFRCAIPRSDSILR